jgi:hypothetical protein
MGILLHTQPSLNRNRIQPAFVSHQELIELIDGDSTQRIRSSAHNASFRGVVISPLSHFPPLDIPTAIERILKISPSRGISFGKPVKKPDHLSFDHVLQKDAAEYYVSVHRTGLLAYREMIWRDEEFDFCLRRSIIVTGLMMDYAERFFREFGYLDSVNVRMSLHNIAGKRLDNHPGGKGSEASMSRRTDDLFVQARSEVGALNKDMETVLMPMVKEIMRNFGLRFDEETTVRYLKAKLAEAFPDRY